jgi:hypothetical protein
MQTISQIFIEDAEKLLAETKARIAEEDAAWARLIQSEKDRINAERAALLSLPSEPEQDMEVCENCDCTIDECECDLDEE